MWVFLSLSQSLCVCMSVYLPLYRNPGVALCSTPLYRDCRKLPSLTTTVPRILTSVFLFQVRRSIKIRGRRKDKEKLPSGITADYTADFLASLERTESPVTVAPGFPSHTSHHHQHDGYTQSDSSETSLNSLSNPQNHKNLPPLPPKPPKRGILKTPKVSTCHIKLIVYCIHRCQEWDIPI